MEKKNMRAEILSRSARIDVLNLEWASGASRDRMAASLVCTYLRRQGFSVVEYSVHDGLDAIDRLRPRVLFMTNTIGARENFEVMRYAVRRGVRGISMVAEGNFLEGKGDEVQSGMIWGWNSEKVMYEDLQLQWSERTRRITLHLHPELKGRVRVSGGVGFDNYKIGTAGDHSETLRLLGKATYERVVGVGCWDFGTLEPEDPRYEAWGKYCDAATQANFRADGRRFRDVLADVIARNPSVLFLLKEHPGVLLGRKASGIDGLDLFDNVVIVKNELPIAKCIAVSDVWLVYESTTALEAWLTGRQTALVNPSGRDFPRDVLHQGSPNYATADMVCDALDQFFTSGELPGFAERQTVREALIGDVIQWADGLNHVRAGNEIIELILQKPALSMRSEDIDGRLRRWRQHTRWLLKSRRSETSPPYNFCGGEAARFAGELQVRQGAYYDRLGLAPSDLLKIRAK